MIRYCLRIVDTNNADDISFFEDLMTRSINESNVAVVKQEATWTKEGKYLIAVHWTEDGASDKDIEKIRELIRDGGL